jgi:phage I-like protein
MQAIRLHEPPAGQTSTWIQVAVAGDYSDSRYGQFSITREMLEAMVLNFSSGKFPEPPTEICVDYDHLTTKESKIPGDGKAAGWFKELQTRNKGTELWARVEWTDAGADAIRSKEYKFFSPYFTSNFETNAGEEIGPCLINGAITNRPFLQGMQPLTLNAHALVDRQRDQSFAASVEKEFPLDVVAARLRAADPKLTSESAIALALKQNPELYDPAWMPAHESIVAAAVGCSIKPSSLEAAAALLRCADQTLTEEQAIVRALEQNPSLYKG